MKRLARYIEVFIVNPWMRRFGGDILMRLKSLFVGGLSLLMLGLFPTAVWASEEGRPVEMSVAAVKQYYRDRDYVSLFDALVFAGGVETNVSRAPEIYYLPTVYRFGALKHLEPVFSKVNKVYFRFSKLNKVYLRDKQSEFPNRYRPVAKTSQELFFDGGVLFSSTGLSDKEFERQLQAEVPKVQLKFPQTPDYRDQISALFTEIKRTQKTANRLSEKGSFPTPNWFSCSHLRIGHSLKGLAEARVSAPRRSTITVWMFNGRFPHPDQIKACMQAGFLSVVGLLGSIHPKLSGLHVASNGELKIGRELQCALDVLYHPQISDGMDREKALSVLTALPKEELHCE